MNAVNKYLMALGIGKFLKLGFARLFNPNINSKPSLVCNYVDRKNEFYESEINILLEAEC